MITTGVKKSIYYFYSKRNLLAQVLLSLHLFFIQPVCLKNTFYFITEDYRNSLNVIGSVNIHFAIAVSSRLLLYFSHVRICHILRFQAGIKISEFFYCYYLGISLRYRLIDYYQYHNHFHYAFYSRSLSCFRCVDASIHYSSHLVLWVNTLSIVRPLVKKHIQKISL